jgi:hypothetical protein
MRPPITAGPIERAFRFLKSTSVSGGGVGEGVGVAGDDKGAVTTGDIDGDASEIGRPPKGVDSSADRIAIAKIEASKAQKMEDRTVIGSRL